MQSGKKPMRSIRARAPAKINLFLRVLSRRPDGYHNIETLFQAIDLYDELIFEESSGPSTLEVTGIPELETENNLVIRALKWLQEHVAADLRVKIRLSKKIPMAAGLGGGSSDAAAALLAIRKLFHLPIPDEELRSAAVSLGADVPFFFAGGSAVGEGIGEVLTPVAIPQNYGLLMLNPGFPVSTPQVYSEFSRTLTGRNREDRLWSVLREARAVADLLYNDLQAVTEGLYPEVSEIRIHLEQNALTGILMSGSGPTVFGITEPGQEEHFGGALPSEWTMIASRPINNGVTLD
jgi:4-diphosphocytidyl-2-C-methyl-D-erythritol kinase